MDSRDRALDPTFRFYLTASGGYDDLLDGTPTRITALIQANFRALQRVVSRHFYFHHICHTGEVYANLQAGSFECNSSVSSQNSHPLSRSLY